MACGVQLSSLIYVDPHIINECAKLFNPSGHPLNLYMLIRIHRDIFVFFSQFQTLLFI